MVTTLEQILEFREFSIESKNIYYHYFKLSKSELSNSCFASRWAWNPCFLYYYTIISDCLCLVSTIEKINELHLVMPMGEVDTKKLQIIIDRFYKFFSNTGKPLKIMYVEERHLEMFHELVDWNIKYDLEADCADYVYLLNDLTELKGKKYRSPRKHINRFIKEREKYVYQYLTKEDITECISLAVDWCNHKELEKYNIMENDFIPLERVLNNYFQLDLIGGVIKNSEGVQAFIIGSKNFNTITVHFQKASYLKSDLYAAMQYMFCKSVSDDVVRYINREDDMGLENIRKTKLAYHPTKRVAKYTLTLQPKGGENSV